MLNEVKSKLINIINNNTKWPLVLEGLSSKKFPKAVVVPADLPSSELGVISDETGLKYPDWIKEIMDKSKQSKKVILCIDGLDTISQDSQEKFYGLMKYKGVNGFKFPEETQIIITVDDASKLSKKILDLALVYKVEG